MQRLEEMKDEWAKGPPQWGIFSQGIPGRVGYQCANFYRKLIIDGEIIDKDYVIDEKGKLHYCFKYSNHPRMDTNEPVVSKYEEMCEGNPLSGAIDSITGEEIKAPAMSPDGNVLDYNTWLTILRSEHPIDPFTQNKLNKRQLIILNKKNFEEYRPMIKNITF